MKYQDKLNEIQMLLACKDTIEMLCANAFLDGQKSIMDHFYFDYAVEQTKGTVQKYITDLGSEANDKN